MSNNSRKHRGYKTERSVAAYLSQWWPHALANGAGRSGNDVTGIPFINLEIKARSAFQPKAWIDQVEKRSEVGGGLNLVVCRMNGQGDSGEAVENYLAFMRFSDLVDLLVKAGYAEFGQVMGELEPERCNKCGAWKFKDLTCKSCSVASSNANL